MAQTVSSLKRKEETVGRYMNLFFARLEISPVLQAPQHFAKADVNSAEWMG